MAKASTSAIRRVPGQSDAIRIVPLAVTNTLLQPLAGAPSAAAAKLTYRGGPLLTAVEVVTIFWGSAWKQTGLAALQTRMNSFFDFVLTSPLIDQMAEYSVPGKAIGHGKRTASINIATPKPGSSVTDAAIQTMLQKLIAKGSGLPKPNANTLYFVYVPPGTRVVQGGGASCQAFCGYHSNIGKNLFYAVMPYPGCSGCTAGLSIPDALTSTSSHELCEAITDPIPGQGWYDDSNGEIGDICAWKSRTLGGFTVQLEWSNTANACV